MPLKKTPNKSTKQNRLKHFEWRETDQLAIYKNDQGIKQDSTTKQLQQRDLNPRHPDLKYGDVTTGQSASSYSFNFFTLTSAYTS